MNKYFNMSRVCSGVLALSVMGVLSSPVLVMAASNELVSYPQELAKPEDDISVDVQGYVIDGLELGSQDQIAKITQPYVGKSRSYEDLVNAAAAVSKYMQKDLGLYVGFAYLPAQKPLNGVVHIVALEGRLDEVKLNWEESLPVKREVVERHLEALRSGAVLKTSDIERVVFLINDLQGIRAKFEIEPGRTPGTASLVVTPSAEKRLSGKVELDNFGAKYTGSGRLSGSAVLSSPFGLGDSLSVNALGSQGDGLRYRGVSYQSPVGGTGAKLGLSASHVAYAIDENAFFGELHGDITSASLFSIYPFVRSRNFNLFGLVSYEGKHYHDVIFDFLSRKSSNSGQISLLGDFRDGLLGGALNTYELSWTQGRYSFDSSDTRSFNLKNQYGKASVSFSRLQNVISNRFQFYSAYRGQIANTPLDYTERLAVGGSTGVRAYGTGEGSADTAHILNIEARFLPYEQWLGKYANEMSFSAFYDWGHARHSYDSFGPSESETLSGFGLGFTWARSNDFSFRMNLAWRAAGQPIVDDNRHEPRASALLSKNF